MEHGTRYEMGRAGREGDTTRTSAGAGVAGGRGEGSRGRMRAGRSISEAENVY
jgi:hypothetical protein